MNAKTNNQAQWSRLLLALLVAVACTSGVLRGATPPACSAHAENDIAAMDVVAAQKTGGNWTVEFVITLKANNSYKTDPYNWANCPTTASDSNGYAWELTSSEPKGWATLQPGMKTRGKLKFTRPVGDVTADSFSLSVCRGFGPAEGRWHHNLETYRFPSIPANCVEPKPSAQPTPSGSHGP